MYTLHPVLMLGPFNRTDWMPIHTDVPYLNDDLKEIDVAHMLVLGTRMIVLAWDEDVDPSRLNDAVDRYHKDMQKKAPPKLATRTRKKKKP